MNDVFVHPSSPSSGWSGAAGALIKGLLIIQNPSVRTNPRWNWNLMGGGGMPCMQMCVCVGSYSSSSVCVLKKTVRTLEEYSGSIEVWKILSCFTCVPWFILEKIEKKRPRKNFRCGRTEKSPHLKGGGKDGQNKTGSRLMMESAEKVWYWLVL